MAIIGRRLFGACAVFGAALLLAACATSAVSGQSSTSTPTPQKVASAGVFNDKATGQRLYIVSIGSQAAPVYLTPLGARPTLPQLRTIAAWTIIHIACKQPTGSHTSNKIGLVYVLGSDAFNDTYVPISALYTNIEIVPLCTDIGAGAFQANR